MHCSGQVVTGRRVQLEGENISSLDDEQEIVGCRVTGIFCNFFGAT